ncbi:MAG TPA: thiamine phosphate synthase [Usitatibacter sp.]|nr:thiamine phosphate synthase [Usitatibacter sp.]
MASSRILRGLYAITPPMAETAALSRAAGECLAGGAALLQYRAKQAPPGLALTQARELRRLCREHGALFIVNDSPELALAVEADGVHLGRDDEEPRAARLLLPVAVIGVSCYDRPEHAREAAAAGADYVAIGSVFASGTKPSAARAPLEAIAQARSASGLPVAAIGGITPDNAAALIECGADMLAVVSAVFAASDVRAAARRFARLFEQSQGVVHARAQPRAV